MKNFDKYMIGMFFVFIILGSVLLAIFYIKELQQKNKLMLGDYDRYTDESMIKATAEDQNYIVDYSKGK